MYTTFLFDLDGTLTDPKEGIVNSVLYALKQLGIEELHVSELESFIGPPIQQSLVERYNMNEGEVERAVFYFREYLKQRGLLENNVYEGIPNLLKQLKDTGNRLFIATSKPTVFAKQVLEHFQLTDYFQDIIGSNLDGTRIKKEEIIAHILQTNEDLNKEEIVMIGDRKHDIIGANYNGIASVGILYGYGSETELNEVGATHIVNDIKELHYFCVENSLVKK
ncbi:MULTISPECIES: HAD family hydrolase [Bacillus]|uniref:Phosphoglycolate phosphatase n=2 Tax=Bacillus cereus group TaxID=86661 RepID=A0A2A7D6S4_BACAN|nr:MULTISPECIES: HAD family hydrolase [Bacillus]MCP1163463.1 HAD family hydrolase [Bacillus sp. 1813sda1]MDC7972726.1 HAD family hydrolase [Bacillus sp. BLCC-B18]OTW72289.1 phosphoglycolate phosphatase [Bacillus thuringiensis serovar coreanensis]OTX49346.1 phosphoglycolate phosphatase [Bacillus thuringiensis serovar sooncheon]OTX57477.1 phosphoglycolate phosphatase [Bacillus thuringiensis serovar guiyangiensis]